MTPIRCRTNLDLRHEEWPTELPSVPNVGDLIESKTRHTTRENDIGIRLQLRVCSITWKTNFHGTWYAEIELHLPERPFENISHFTNWYDHICGYLSKEEYIRREELRKSGIKGY